MDEHGKIDCEEVDEHGKKRLSGGGKTGEIYCREVDEQGEKQYSDIGWTGVTCARALFRRACLRFRTQY